MFFTVIIENVYLLLLFPLTHRLQNVSSCKFCNLLCRLPQYVVSLSSHQTFPPLLMGTKICTYSLIMMMMRFYWIMSSHHARTAKDQLTKVSDSGPVWGVSTVHGSALDFTWILLCPIFLQLLQILYRSVSVHPCISEYVTLGVWIFQYLTIPFKIDSCFKTISESKSISNSVYIGFNFRIYFSLFYETEWQSMAWKQSTVRINLWSLFFSFTKCKKAKILTHKDKP